MASIRKVKDKWLAEVRIKGKFLSKVHATKYEAKDWAHAEERKIRILKDGGILEGKTLGQAFDRYAREESHKKKGVREEIIRLERLQRDELASILLTDLRSDDIDAYIKREETRGLKGASIRRTLQSISPVLTIARKRWKWLEGNPMENVDLPKKSPPRKKLITDQEITNTLLALGYEEGKPVETRRQKVAVAFLFAIETAMRHGEIWKMQWEDINWKECFVILRDTKNGHDREVPLSTRAIQLLQKLNPGTKGGVLSDFQQHKGELVIRSCFRQEHGEVLFREATEKAGYKGVFTFHDTRHRAITRLADKLDMLTLARMVGHLDPRMLMTYYNPTSASIAKRLG